MYYSFFIIKAFEKKPCLKLKGRRIFIADGVYSNWLKLERINFCLVNLMNQNRFSLKLR